MGCNSDMNYKLGDMYDGCLLYIDCCVTIQWFEIIIILLSNFIINALKKFI
jgi:hypothetical protein